MKQNIVQLLPNQAQRLFPLEIANLMLDKKKRIFARYKIIFA
jgi:hypothetical protein